MALYGIVGAGGHGRETPEQRLQFAVLEDAIDQIRKPGSVKPIASHAAKQEALGMVGVYVEEG